MLRQGLGRNHCGSRRPLLAMTYRLCPHSSHGARSIGRPRSPAKSQRLIRIRPHAKSGAAERVNRAPFPPHFLRVAASSNPSIEGMPKRLRHLCTPHVKRLVSESPRSPAMPRKLGSNITLHRAVDVTTITTCELLSTQPSATRHYLNAGWILMMLH